MSTTAPAMSPEGAAAEPYPFSARDFRNALGSFATGITVITTMGDEHPYGMTANAFSSVSLDPPLVLVCVIKGTEGAESIAKNGVFAVNVLGADQEPISRYFASRDRPRGWEGFKQISHSTAASGSPIIDGTTCFFDCHLHAAHEAGDHIIFIGEVMAMGNEMDVMPVLFHRGKYRYLHEEEG
jgi:flavin reductase (DIM6/NTAB) family NADH-FMN oxidoreductase RutF